MTTFRRFLSLIKRCQTIKHLHQLHAYSLTTGIFSSHSLSIPSTILHTFTTLSPPPTNTTATPLITYILSLFGSIQNPPTFCYNNVIRALTLLSSPYRALLFFTQMLRYSVPLDFHSLPFALKACAQLGAITMSRTLHSYALKLGCVADLFIANSFIRVYSSSGCIDDTFRMFDESPQRDIVSFNTIIDGFVKLGEIERAHKMFDEMPERDSVSWGTLVSGYARVSRCEEALELFNQMIEMEVQPHNMTLVSALSACAQLGEIDQGRRIHDYIKRNSIPVDSFLCTALVDFYAKCGCIDIANKLFERNTQGNIYTWNAMIVGLAVHGQGHLSLDYFSRMIAAGVQPDDVTLLGVLVGCSHSGLVQEACKIFDEMESVYGVTRELKHYGCMADLLARAGLVGEAGDMIKRMPSGGDIFMWGGLLGGCKIHSNVEIAEKAAREMMQSYPEDGGAYSIMTGVYACANRWEDVVKTRASLSAGIAKKVSACSVIKVNEAVHEFLSSDTMHPQTEDIYLLLNALDKHQMEAH